MIYLIRHGQTDWNVINRIQGQLDMPLNETGRKEASMCAQKLINLKLDEIVSSDLSRTKETTRIINESLSLPVRFDPRLREVNCGDLQGVIAKEIPEETWYTFNHDPHKLHAESLADVYNRVKSFFNEVDATKNTLIVTHAGVVRMAMYLAHSPQSYDQNDFEKTVLQFKIKNTEIFSWDKAQKFQLLTNEPLKKSNSLEY